MLEQRMPQREKQRLNRMQIVLSWYLPKDSHLTLKPLRIMNFKIRSLKQREDQSGGNERVSLYGRTIA